MKKLLILLFTISILFIPKVYAESVNVNFASFWEESTNYGGLTNNGEVNGYWNTNSNVLIIPDTTYAFVFNNANVCSGTSALIKGKFGQYGNANFNQLVDNVQMTYNNNANFETCTFTADNSSSGQLYNFTCSMPQGNTNLFSLKFRTKNVFSTQFSNKMLIVNKLDITCGGSGVTDTTTIENNQQTIINQNETIINNQNETNDLLTDSSTPSSSSVDSFFNNIKQLIPTNETISDLLLLPIRLMTKLIYGIGSNCVPHQMEFFYNQPLTWPCIDLSTFLGSNLWTTIDLLICGFMIYRIAMKMIQIYNAILLFNDHPLMKDFTGGAD